MKLVLLDLDNTLINSNYKLTVPEVKFRTVIQELARKDVQVGLCSDSATITLRQWADRLGLTGPIVAERGAVVWNPAEQIENILEISETAWFRSFRELFVHNVMRNFQNATIMIGDATKFVKDRNVSAALISQVFAINGFRIASFSFFACNSNSDRSALEPDQKLLEQASALATEMLKEYDKKKEDLFWDENSKYGILIVHARSTEKWRGVSNLINRLMTTQVVMVGDGMSDYLGLPNVIQHAVGNADPRYKEKCVFVSKCPLTEGVVECLEQCL